MNPYETHLPVLQAVMGHINPGYVLECGMGLYSTPLLALAPRCISIETESMEWYAKVVDAVGPRHGWTPVYSKANSEADMICYMTHGTRPDIVLIDGAKARCESASIACVISDVVICHDSESHPYSNNLLIPGYQFLDIRVLTPGTCVFTNNESLITMLKERFHV